MPDFKVGQTLWFKPLQPKHLPFSDTIIRIGHKHVTTRLYCVIDKTTNDWIETGLQTNAYFGEWFFSEKEMEAHSYGND